MSRFTSPRLIKELSAANIGETWIKLNKVINKPGVIGLGQGFPDFGGE